MTRFAVVMAVLFLAVPVVAQTPPAPSSGAPAAPAPPPPPPPPPDSWLPRGNVDLTGLDKISTRISTISGKVGQAMSFGTLSVTVRSCIVRGPDQPADQAAFLDVTDSRNPGFSFHGWMLLSAPADSVIEHPVYDLRLAACRP